MDFGTAVFSSGQQRFIEVAIKPAGSNEAFVTLSPRTRLSATPYTTWSLVAQKAGSADSAGTANQANTANRADTAGRADSAEVADTLKPGAIINGLQIEVHNSTHDGFRVIGAAASGVYVDQATYSFFSSNARAQGLVVDNAGGTAIDIFGPGNQGIYISDAVSNGVWVNNPGGAAFYTTNAQRGVEVSGSSDLAGVFQGDIHVEGACQSCILTVIGRNDSQQILELGDIVAVNGIASLEDIPYPVISATKADATSMIFGVVNGYIEVQHGDAEAESGTYWVPRTGNAESGAYISIVTQGLAQVKLSAKHAAFKAGSRLTLGNEPGSADLVGATEHLQQNETNLLSSQSIGMAVEQSDGTQQLVWVLVNPR